jgi:hypothetical protein
LSELSWLLCVLLWRSCYVRWQWNGFQYSSTCCQARRGTCGHVLSCQALNVAASQGPGSSGTYPILNGPRRVPSRASQREGMRLTGLIGDEILTTHGYRYKEKDWCGLLPGLVRFRLVAPPLQPGVVVPYLVWGAWFPSHLSLEGIDRIQISGS